MAMSIKNPFIWFQFPHYNYPSEKYHVLDFCVLTLSDGNIHNYFGNTTKMFFPFSAMYQWQTVSCTSTKHIIAD